MGVGAILEPLVVVVLLFGGAWINRAPSNSRFLRQSRWSEADAESKEKAEVNDQQLALIPHHQRSLSPSLLPSQEQPRRQRQICLLGWRRTIQTPNTAMFRNRLLSRLLQRFPFLVEAWYWFLIYWFYQLGRAFTALTIKEDTVHVAREHALQVIALEKRLHIFWELPIQQYFMQFPILMRSINWLYSFIHIPGTISFLVLLYYYTITTDSVRISESAVNGSADSPSYGPQLYQSRRRTMAICNLMAFIVFTLWPCMPPRLLSDETVEGEIGQVARSFSFVDTVHGANGAVSVWTANKFCNQWAAMPSLHFGYSLLVGCTIMTLPLAQKHRRSKSIQLPFFNQSHPQLAPSVRLPSTERMFCIGFGFFYPFSILVAIISTANHFILDAVAGAMICAIGWNTNDMLLNLLPIEDWFLWCLRIHKPEVGGVKSVPEYSWRMDANAKSQHGM